MLRAMRSFLGENDMMAYLTMMAVRLIELHRVLKPTGSLYLHCDPTASRYLKILLDAIFGEKNFWNEIVWQQTAAKGDAKAKLAWNHDVILCSGKTERPFFVPIYAEKDEEYSSRFKLDDKDGRGKYRLAPLDVPSRTIVSVKAGDNVGVAMLRDLRGVIERERAEIGIFLTLTPPTRPMVAEAAAAGQYHEDGFDPVPRIQIVSIEDALTLRDRAVRLPARRDDTFRKAAREEDRSAQGKLDN